MLSSLFFKWIAVVINMWVLLLLLHFWSLCMCEWLLQTGLTGGELHDPKTNKRISPVCCSYLPIKIYGNFYILCLSLSNTFFRSEATQYWVVVRPYVCNNRHVRIGISMSKLELEFISQQDIFWKHSNSIIMYQRKSILLL